MSALYEIIANPGLGFVFIQHGLYVLIVQLVRARESLVEWDDDNAEPTLFFSFITESVQVLMKGLFCQFFSKRNVLFSLLSAIALVIVGYFSNNA